jgi:hypothetical protein
MFFFLSMMRRAPWGVSSPMSPAKDVGYKNIRFAYSMPADDRTQSDCGSQRKGYTTHQELQATTNHVFPKPCTSYGHPAGSCRAVLQDYSWHTDCQHYSTTYTALQHQSCTSLHRTCVEEAVLVCCLSCHLRLLVVALIHGRATQTHLHSRQQQPLSSHHSTLPALT